jgi:hypothetical protein
MSTHQPSLMDAIAEAAVAAKASTSTFNASAGTTRKEFGMNQAAEARAELLAECRAAVLKAALGRATREATADDSARYLETIGLSADALGNAAGSLFRGRGWRKTGRMQNSSRESNHAHANCVWEYTGA